MNVNLILVVLGLAAIAVVVGFIWINRNKPDELDKVEEKIRSFRK